MNVNKRSLLLGILIFVPLLHFFGQMFPYLIMFGIAFGGLILSGGRVDKTFFCTFLFLFGLIVISTIRQEGLFQFTLSDLSFAMKFLLMFLIGILAGALKSKPNVNFIIVCMWLLVLVALLQGVFKPLQFFYNNKNLVDQNRLGSIGVTHYEAVAISIILGAVVMAEKVCSGKALNLLEGLTLSAVPLALVLFSMSKAAFIVVFLWVLLVVVNLKSKWFFLALFSVFLGVGGFLYWNNILVVLYGLGDLLRFESTTNLSIITRKEDFSNFFYLLSEYNLIVGLGLNRSSYFHYFEVGVLSHLAASGFIFFIGYYTLLLWFSSKIFYGVKKYYISFFLLLFIADLLVNFTDGVKSLIILSFLALSTLPDQVSRSPIEN